MAESLRLNHQSLAQMAAKGIREAIYTGRFAPGGALREQVLAREFGISQNTVREALLELQNLGLVRRLRNRATYVTELSAEDIRKRIVVRVPREEIAFVEASERLDYASDAALTEKLAALEAAIASNDYAGYAMADLDFHRSVWRLSGNELLSGVLDQITAPLFAFLSICLQQRRVNLVDVADPHRPLLESLRGGDPERIRRIIRDHIATSYPASAAGAGPVPISEAQQE